MVPETLHCLGRRIAYSLGESQTVTFRAGPSTHPMQGWYVWCCCARYSQGLVHTLSAKGGQFGLYGPENRLREVEKGRRMRERRLTQNTISVT